MRRFAVLLSALLFVSASQTAWGAVQYGVTSLGFDPVAINNSGQVAGNYGAYEGLLTYEGVYLYSGGATQAIGLNSAAAINNSGQVAGEADSSAAVWSGGAVQLVVPGEYPGYTATGINDSGQVAVFDVGSVYPFLYNGGVLQSLPGGRWQPTAINNAGQIIGGNGIYSSGVFQSIGMDGLAINNSGQVAGYVPFNGYHQAAVYAGGTVQLLGPPLSVYNGGVSSIAYGINSNGQVVGQSGLYNGGAFLYSGGVMQDLNSLIAPGLGITLTSANAINDNGQIACDYNAYQGYLLTPPALTTNPGTGGILSFGAVLVGTTGTANATATNSGPSGSSFSGAFPTATGNFGSGAAAAFGPLGSGQQANQQYTYTPAARGSDSQTITITSDISNSTITLAGTGVAPVQSVDTSAANAGLARIGTTTTAGFTVNNIGDGNLSGMGTVSNLNGTAATGSGPFSGSGGSLSLADKGNQTFNYVYTPTTHTSDSASIPVQFSNGSADGANLSQAVNVELGGQGVGPIFQSGVAPGSTLSYGTATIGIPKPVFLVLSNTSADPNGGNSALTDLTVLSASITGPDSGLFSIVGFTPGATLSENDSLDLEIDYNGTGTAGAQSASLTIGTDEGAALGVSGDSFTYPISANLVPEPSTLALLGAGAVGLLGYRSLRRRQKHSLSVAGDDKMDSQEGSAVILSLPSHWTSSAQRAA